MGKPDFYLKFRSQYYISVEKFCSFSLSASVTILYYFCLNHGYIIVDWVSVPMQPAGRNVECPHAHKATKIPACPCAEFTAFEAPSSLLTVIRSMKFCSATAWWKCFPNFVKESLQETTFPLKALRQRQLTLRIP